ncbi:MAG: T9SS type A sorting domain-containing protein [Lewinellaceae bacterium]|nr:T9SS type A sorting domain-containing protein [Lewinellaceae bacterium]
MRFIIVPALLIAATTLHAQHTNSSPGTRQLHYLLKEKVKLKDIPAALDWFRQHPEMVGMADPGNTTLQPASLRSSEIVVHDDNKAESEVHAAINPSDTANVIVAAILQDVNSITSPLKVPVYYTKDFGTTWASSSIQFSPNPGDGIVAGGGDPVLVFDHTGKAYLSWLVLNIDLFGDQTVKLSLYYSTSSNQGQTWSTPVLVDFGTITLDVLQGGNGAGALVDKQWMACDRGSSIYQGNIYVSYTRIDIADTSNVTSTILVKTKAPNNDFFGAAVQAHQGVYATMQFSSIDVDGQGNVHVLFFAGNSDDDYALYHAVSDNGGASFQPETKITDIHFPGVGESAANPIDGISAERLYPCPHLRAGKTSGALYAVWTADGLSMQETEGYDIWFSKSTDNGQNWQTPKRVNAGDDPQAEQFYPAISVNVDGVICLAYYDRNDDPAGTKTHHVVAYSYDEGDTFTAPAKATLVASDFASIGALNGDFGIGEYTQIVSTGHFAMPVWADGRNNNGDIDLYASVLPIYAPVSGAGEAGTLTDAFSFSAPNPAKSEIDLRVALEKPMPFTLQVFSQDGKMVFEERQKSPQPAGAYSRRVPLPRGIYSCRVQTPFGYKVKQVVVD